MKKVLAAFAIALACTAAGRADDRLRNVQAELKTQGFYYGEVNGQNTSETGAAIRRYQIRNGLEVTGTLTDETIKSLGIAIGGRPPQEAPPAAPAAPPPPVAPRRDEALEQSDKNFLRREEARQRAAEPPPRVEQPPSDEDDPSVVPAPRPLDVPSPDLPVIFADTPYASAPPEVQEATLRRAQSLLASRGIYREAIDGEPGPATEEAILTYQRGARLRLTGRLDLETLSSLRLLPGRAPVPLKGFIPEEERQTSGPRALRGIWIR